MGREIEILAGLEAVRVRPEKYVGSVTSAATLSHLVEQAMCAALDDAVAAACTRIAVTLQRDGSASVSDDGRGWPVDESSDGIRRAEQLMLTLGVCRAERQSRGVGKRFCNMGIAVVNALSQRCELVTRRDGWRWEQRYRDGKPVTPFERVAADATRGTTLTFRPDPEILPCSFDADDLAARLDEIRKEAPGCEIRLVDER